MEYSRANPSASLSPVELSTTSTLSGAGLSFETAARHFLKRAERLRVHITTVAVRGVSVEIENGLIRAGPHGCEFNRLTSTKFQNALSRVSNVMAWTQAGEAFHPDNYLRNYKPSKGCSQLLLAPEALQFTFQVFRLLRYCRERNQGGIKSLA